MLLQLHKKNNKIGLYALQAVLGKRVVYLPGNKKAPFYKELF